MINVDKETFIKVCNESKTMSQASYSLGLHFNTFKRYAVKYGCYAPNRGGKGTKKPIIRYKLEDILAGKHPDYQSSKLNRRLVAEGIKENRCEMCGINSWNGKQLQLELHHIDGNRNNHSLDNLMLLCPNCHSQTDNFRARNLKSAAATK